MNLAVESVVDGDRQIFKLIGILDFSTVDSFNIDHLINESIKEFEVDFSDLEFIDSTGIGAILTILHKASSLNAQVQFTGLNAEKIDLFETIGVFDIKKSLLGEV
jgi:anti-anti-sigma factor